MVCQLDKFGVCAFYASNLGGAKFGEICLSIALVSYRHPSPRLLQTYVNIESNGRVLLPRPLKAGDFRL